MEKFKKKYETSKIAFMVSSMVFNTNIRKNIKDSFDKNAQKYSIEELKEQIKLILELNSIFENSIKTVEEQNKNFEKLANTK